MRSKWHCIIIKLQKLYSRKTNMEMLKERDLLNQMSILLPGKMEEIKRHTTSYWERKPAKEVKMENRKANVIFSMIVVFILAFISFSIWLSVEVGINKKRIWGLEGRITFDITLWTVYYILMRWIVLLHCPVLILHY